MGKLNNIVEGITTAFGMLVGVLWLGTLIVIPSAILVGGIKLIMYCLGV